MSTPDRVQWTTAPVEWIHGGPEASASPPIAPKRASGPDWLSIRDLCADPQTLERVLHRMQQARKLPPDDRMLAGSTFALVYSAVNRGLVERLWEGRPIYRMPPDTTWVRLSDAANPLEISLGDTAHISGTGADGVAAVLSAVVEHFEPLVEAVREATRFSRRGQWALIAGTMAENLLALGRANSDTGRAAALIDQLMAPDTPLGTAPPKLEIVDRAGSQHVLSCRSVCCLYYKAHGYCTTVCPLVEDDERINAALDAIVG